MSITKKVAFASLAATIAAFPAFAQEPDEGLTVTYPSVAVSYADLNLSHPSGVEALDRRLHRAAKAVCSIPGEDLRQVDSYLGFRSCMIDAADGYREQRDDAIKGGTVEIASRKIRVLARRQ